PAFVVAPVEDRAARPDVLERLEKRLGPGTLAFPLRRVERRAVRVGPALAVEDLAGVEVGLDRQRPFEGTVPSFGGEVLPDDVVERAHRLAAFFTVLAYAEALCTKLRTASE